MKTKPARVMDRFEKILFEFINCYKRLKLLVSESFLSGQYCDVL